MTDFKPEGLIAHKEIGGLFVVTYDHGFPLFDAGTFYKESFIRLNEPFVLVKGTQRNGAFVIMTSRGHYVVVDYDIVHHSRQLS